MHSISIVNNLLGHENINHIAVLIRGLEAYTWFEKYTLLLITVSFMVYDNGSGLCFTKIISPYTGLHLESYFMQNEKGNYIHLMLYRFSLSSNKSTCSTWIPLAPILEHSFVKVPEILNISSLGQCWDCCFFNLDREQWDSKSYSREESLLSWLIKKKGKVKKEKEKREKVEKERKRKGKGKRMHTQTQGFYYVGCVFFSITLLNMILICLM